MTKPYWIAPVLVLALGLTGCGGATTSGGPVSSTSHPVATAKPSPSMVPAKPAVNLKDPASVAAAFVAGAYAWDTTTDRTRTDALKRVGSLATPKYSKEFIAPQKPSLGAEWLTATQHKAVSVPSITAIPTGTDHELNTAAPFRILAFRAQWTWLGSDGVKLSGGDELATVTLDKDGAGSWHVSAFFTTDAGQ